MSCAPSCSRCRGSPIGRGVGGGGCPSNPYHPPCPNKNSPSKRVHLMARLAWCVLLRATSCVRVRARVLLGVCSSNKGKHCVLHCLIRHQAWLCSALSACLISVHASVRSAVELDVLAASGSSGEGRFWGRPPLVLLCVCENEFVGV